MPEPDTPVETIRLASHANVPDPVNVENKNGSVIGPKEAASVVSEKVRVLPQKPLLLLQNTWPEVSNGPSVSIIAPRVRLVLSVQKLVVVPKPKKALTLFPRVAVVSKLRLIDCRSPSAESKRSRSTEILKVVVLLAWTLHETVLATPESTSVAALDRRNEPSHEADDRYY